MPRTYSTGEMLKRLEGLLSTKDLTDWEHEFVESLTRRNDLTKLSEHQVEKLEELHNKHFA